jgi:hypothetical protein
VSFNATEEASGATDASATAAGASSFTGASSALGFLVRGLAAAFASTTGAGVAAATTGVVTGAETDLDVLTILAIILYYHVSFLSYFLLNIYFDNMCHSIYPKGFIFVNKNVKTHIHILQLFSFKQPFSKMAIR